MNTDYFSKNWNELKSTVQKQWDKLTNDHVDHIGGDREKFVAAIQDAYGVEKDESERQIKSWEKTLKGHKCG